MDERHYKRLYDREVQRWKNADDILQELKRIRSRSLRAAAYVLLIRRGQFTIDGLPADYFSLQHIRALEIGRTQAYEYYKLAAVLDAYPDLSGNTEHETAPTPEKSGDAVQTGPKEGQD